jgi:ribosomal protein S4
MALHKTKPQLKKYKKAGLFNKKDTSLSRVNFYLPEYTYLNLYLKKLEHTYTNSLNNRRKVKLLSGFSQVYKLNKFITDVEKKAKKNWRFSKSTSLVALIERRLDIILYRVGFASTLSQSRQLISHRNVLVNGVVVTSSFFLLKKGDVISFSPNIRSNIVKNVKQTIYKRKYFLSMFNHLEVNLTILKTILVEENSKSKGYFYSLNSKQDWNLIFSQ